MTGARPPAPDEILAARAVFGDRLPLAARYAELLVTAGVERGLVGPREAPRIWQRHLLNSAVVAELVPAGAVVTDVGSGAGLPGVALALARPDLTVSLVEPMLRRTTFLGEVLAELSLIGQVTVVRARAEECPGRVPPADVVTARALARLDRLARWCLPLVREGGQVLALKGAAAADEIAAYGSVVRRLGGGGPAVHQCGVGLLDLPTTVVRFVRSAGRPGRLSAGS